MRNDSESARQAFGAVPDKNLSYLGGACDVSYRYISEPRHISYSASVRLCSRFHAIRTRMSNNGRFSSRVAFSTKHLCSPSAESPSWDKNLTTPCYRLSSPSRPHVKIRTTKYE